MRRLKFKKYTPIAIFIFSLIFIFEPVGFAMAATNTPIPNPQNQQDLNNWIAQNQAEIKSQNSGTSQTYSGVGSNVAVGATTCSVGSMLANYITGAVGSVIGSAKGYVSSKLTSTVSSATGGIVSLEVPTFDATTHEKVDVTNHNLSRTTAATAGSAQSSGGLLSSLADGVGSVPWNGVAFCIANEMIRYIGLSTIQWIQNGFKGNPVFVDNPEGFFKSIGDQEAGHFIQQVVGQTTGLNVCKPFKVQLAIDSIGAYTGANPLTCSLSAIKNNYKQFTSGNWNAGGFPGWFELIQPQNNIYGAQQIANKQMLERTAAKSNTALIELNWAKGYKSFKVCKTTRNADGTCQAQPNGQSGEDTTTLGGYIENAVNVRGAAPNHRLEIATTFDQIVSALVNEMIKIAVTDMFSSNNNVSSGSSSNSGSSSSNNSSSSNSPSQLYFQNKSSSPDTLSFKGTPGSYLGVPVLSMDMTAYNGPIKLTNLNVHIFTSEKPTSIVASSSAAFLYEGTRKIASINLTPTSNNNELIASFKNQALTINQNETKNIGVKVDIVGSDQNTKKIQAIVNTTDIKVYDSSGSDVSAYQNGNAAGPVVTLTN